MKKDFPFETDKLEEASNIYICEKGFKILKTPFPDKWTYLSENLAYPYEHFNSVDTYQRPVNIWKRRVFH